MRLAFAVLRNDFRSKIASVLVAVGVAIGVSLVLWLVSAPDALQARADRAAWRSANAAVEGVGRLTVAINRDSYGGRLIERFDVAGDPSTPVAQGIPRVPRAGEVLLSPALAELVRVAPQEKLGDRFPGRVIGTLGDEALQFPDELVAVVGHEPGAVRGFQVESLTGAGSRVGDYRGVLYLLTRVGLVVLVVPCLVLVGSAARLTAARRERRLAALRLAGATPWQIAVMTAVETAVGAVAGSVIGVAVATPLSSLTAKIPWGGGTWFPGDFTAKPEVVVAVAVLAPVLTVGAAVFGLLRGTKSGQRAVDAPSRVAAGTFGPAKSLRKEEARGGSESRVSTVRLLAVVGAAVLFFAGVVVAREHGGGDRSTMVILGVGAVSLALVLAGPVVTAAVGRFFVHRWRGPATLLAGRRLAGDPVAAFRGTAGVVVAVFAGAMALTMLPGLEEQVPYSDDTWREEAIVARDVGDPRQIDALRAATNAPVVPITDGRFGSDERSMSAMVGRCADLAPMLNGLTCGDGPAMYVPRGYETPTGRFNEEPPITNPQVRTYDAHGHGYVVIDPELVPNARPNGIAVLTNAANREVVHTAIVGTLPGVTLHDELQIDLWGDILADDLRRATAIGLAIAALIGGAAAAVSAAGSVIDRRRTFGALIAAGTPVRVLGRALCREVMLPVCAATLAACVAGLGVGLGLLQITRDIAGRGEFPITPWVLAPMAVGIVVALVAPAACGPVLRGVSPRDYASE